MPKPSEIAVLSPHRHPRLRYILRQLSEWWGIKLRLFTQKEQYLACEGCMARINYGGASSGTKELLLYADPFLKGEDGILTNKVAMSVEASGQLLPAELFESAEIDAYDALAAIFFCISRYEEYLPFEADQYGRFPASAAHAYRHGYLEQPVVNQLVNDIARRLQAVFPAVQLRLPAASLQLTYDVDLPFAYRLRGWRGIASGLRDLLTGNFKRSINRYKTAIGKDKDPYDTFEWLKSIHQRHQLKATYFWLLAAKRSSFDPNPATDHPTVVGLIKSIAERAEVGIHPSYYSSEQPALFASERATLATITGTSIEKSRQHFLRFSLPATYRQLLLAGLRQDYSMGYADAVGYRAGTNLPFYWYDLEKEEATWLKIHPFAAMDVTLSGYQKHGYFDSQKILLNLAKTTKAAGGPFTLLWHNSSFASEFGWTGWAKMYEELIDELAALFQTEER